MTIPLRAVAAPKIVMVGCLHQNAYGVLVLTP